MKKIILIIFFRNELLFLNKYIYDFFDKINYFNNVKFENHLFLHK